MGKGWCSRQTTLEKVVWINDKIIYLAIQRLTLYQGNIKQGEGSD
jgi:hypothetical protein